MDVNMSGASFSPCGRYRYSLWRDWAVGIPLVWVMSNPSVADAVEDDLTVKKCCEFSKRAGFAGMVIINLYALRATNPQDLLSVSDPEGPDNVDEWRMVLSENVGSPVVGAWGDSAPRGLPASRAYREHVIAPERPPVWLCLGKTAKGSPKHPSRLAYDTRMVPL